MEITRYMTAAKHERIVAHIFSPELAPGETLDDATPGTARIAIRDTPHDIWPVPRDLRDGVPYGAWLETVERQGFIYD